MKLIGDRGYPRFFFTEFLKYELHYSVQPCSVDHLAAHDYRHSHTSLLRTSNNIICSLLLWFFGYKL